MEIHKSGKRPGRPRLLATEQEAEIYRLYYTENRTAPDVIEAVCAGMNLSTFYEAAKRIWAERHKNGPGSEPATGLADEGGQSTAGALDCTSGKAAPSRERG